MTSALLRGLAAFALVELIGIDEKSGASAVTDGYDDNGIDAIYIDSDSSRVYLVQSKWSKAGSGSPALGDVQKFMKGFEDLINAEFDRFNDKVNAMRDD